MIDHVKDDAKRWADPPAHIQMLWHVFKPRFLERFDETEAKAKLHVTLLTDPQRPREPGRNFVSRKMTLAQRTSDTTWTDLLHVTISLLRPEYRFAVARHDVKFFDELLDFITILDAAKLDAGPSTRPSTSAQAPASDRPSASAQAYARDRTSTSAQAYTRDRPSTSAQALARDLPSSPALCPNCNGTQ